MDRAARGLSPEQEEDLETLAGLAAAQLDARHGRALQASAAHGRRRPAPGHAPGHHAGKHHRGLLHAGPAMALQLPQPRRRAAAAPAAYGAAGKKHLEGISGRHQHAVFGAGAGGGGGQLPGGVRGPVCAAGQMVRDTRLPLSRRLAIYFRRKAQEQLMLLEGSISRLNDIVIITEAAPFRAPGPRIVFVNEAFERRTGYSRDEVMGQSPRFLQGPNTQRRAARSHPRRAGEWRAGAGRPDQLHQERRAVLGRPGRVAGLGRVAAQAHALGGGRPRHHRAQAGRGEDPAPGLLRPADPAAEPAAADGPAARRAGRQPGGRAKAR
jgi:PAS domain-containing protein